MSNELSLNRVATQRIAPEGMPLFRPKWSGSVIRKPGANMLLMLLGPAVIAITVLFFWQLNFFDTNNNRTFARQSNSELCNPQNYNLFSSANGDWYLFRNNTFRFEASNCRLRRFTPKEVQQCMKGSHMLLMGDSLSRYLYISLAYFLTHQRWHVNFIKEVNQSILAENTFQSWAQFYEVTNKALNKETYATEICDCYRDDTRTWGGEPSQQETCFENRHFRFIPNGELNNQHDDIRLSYIQWYGHMPIRGHLGISAVPRNKHDFQKYIKIVNENVCPNSIFFPLQKNCYKFRNDLRKYDFPQFAYKELCPNYPKISLDFRCLKFEEKILSKLQITNAILNIGWHSGLQHFGNEQLLNKFSYGAEKYFKNYKKDQFSMILSKVIWRAATAGAIFEDDEKIAINYYHNTTRKYFDYFQTQILTSKLKIFNELIQEKQFKQLEKIIKIHPDLSTNYSMNAKKIPLIWIDNAHFEPWVYEEIWNIFFNAVCPLQM